MKTTFQIKHIQSKYLCPDDFKFSKHHTKMHTNIVGALKPNVMNSFHCYVLKYAFSLITIRISNFENICFSCIWSKMLSSSIFAIFRLSKTNSPQKLFEYDCIKLQRDSTDAALSLGLPIQILFMYRSGSSLKHFYIFSRRIQSLFDCCIPEKRQHKY